MHWTPLVSLHSYHNKSVFSYSSQKGLSFYNRTRFLLAFRLKDMMIQ